MFKIRFHKILGTFFFLLATFMLLGFSWVQNNEKHLPVESSLTGLDNESLVLTILEEVEPSVFTGSSEEVLHKLELAITLRGDDKVEKNLAFIKKQLIQAILQQSLQTNSQNDDFLAALLWRYDKYLGKASEQIVKLKDKHFEDKISVKRELLFNVIDNYFLSYQLLDYLQTNVEPDSMAFLALEASQMNLIKETTVLKDLLVDNDAMSEYLKEILTEHEVSWEQHFKFAEMLAVLTLSGVENEHFLEVKGFWVEKLMEKLLSENLNAETLAKNILNISGNKLVHWDLVDYLKSKGSLQFLLKYQDVLEPLEVKLVFGVEEYWRQYVSNWDLNNEVSLYFESPDFSKYRLAIVLKEYLNPVFKDELNIILENNRASLTKDIENISDVTSAYNQLNPTGDILDIIVLADWQDFGKKNLDILDELLVFHLEQLQLGVDSTLDSEEIILNSYSIGEPLVIRTIHNLKTPLKYDGFLVDIRESSLEKLSSRLKNSDSVAVLRILEQKINNDRVVEEAMKRYIPNFNRAIRLQKIEIDNTLKNKLEKALVL